ncbi:MAG: GNAT family N-acetyltransferase [Phycisphaerales bacterium]|nr:GNAT family N-acetyltransferase [Phycisphaerales bacterium]
MEGLIFRSGTQALGPEELVGFFEGWPDPPSPETHLEILRNSWAVELAREQTTGRVVGFINAISDGVYSAYIPLLEILPSHRGKGIGQELVRRLLKRCKGFYMVDVCCDEDVVPFYRRFGMIEVKGMCQRSFDFQSGVGSGLKED